MSFYFSLWFSAFLSNGYWEWREQLVFQSLRYSWEKPWSFLWWLPKIVGWKPDGKNENAIQPSAPFLHNFHIKSTWSINCVQHKIALGAEEKMMSPAHSISQGDVGSELPKKSSLANLLGTRASPPKNRTSSCACSNSKTCKTHRHSARKKEHTGSTLTARTGFWLRGQYSGNLCTDGGGKQRNGNTLGGAEEEREKHIYACSHMHTWCLWRLPVHERPSDNLTTCLAQNFICCTLFTIYFLLSV